MGKKVILTSDTEKSIINDYQNSIKIKEICQKHGISELIFYKVLDKYSIVRMGSVRRRVDGEQMTCRKCKETKIREEFANHKGKKITTCKKCVAAAAQKWRDQLSLEKKQFYYKKKYESHLAKMEKFAKGCFSLEEEISLWISSRMNDGATEQKKQRRGLCKIILREKCFEAIKKFPKISFLKGRSSKHNLWAASLDRIDSSQGYTNDNIQVIPLWLNLAKLKSTQEEIDNILFEYVLSHPRFKKIFDEYKNTKPPVP